MPKLSIKAACRLESSFEGRITSFHEAQAEFRGKPRVLVPESPEDVTRALRLARAADRRVFIRSGQSISAADLGRSSAPRAAIVSLEALRGIELDDHRLTVGPAATAGDIARKLADSGLFLPLDDNPTRSIASAVLSMEASPFLRSDAGFGPLRNHVVSADVIPVEGAGAGRVRKIAKKAFLAALAAERPLVITQLVLEAAPARTDDPDRWTRAWTTTYERKSFAALCDALFASKADAVPAGVDLGVRVTSAAYELKLVVLRATGHGEAESAAVAAVVQAALERAALPVLDEQRASAAASVAAWMNTGPGGAAPGEVPARFGSNTAPRLFARFRRQFLDAVDFAIGVSSRTGRERAPGVQAWAELQLAPGGDVIARAAMTDTAADPKVASEARRRISAAIPADRVSPTAAVARRAVVRRASSRAALRGVTVMSTSMPTAGFELVASNHPGAARIPGFRGEVFAAADGASYRRVIHQYAVSSYSQQVVKDRMTPRLVARAVDAADVTTAVTFAAKHGLAVVARSGGHQYCGLSSGGADTLLLDMSLFDRVVFSPAKGTPSRVTVGPGVALRDVSALLRKQGVTIPHGECPLVNLGGHVQTGGIGHQLRSLGATLDWVRSFKMVTRDPAASAADTYGEREFTRPTSAASADPPTDDDVFRALLGGGPGSWGVLTEMTFDLVADSQYPTSQGYSYPYPYLLVEDGFNVAMGTLRDWARRQDAGTLPPGIDLFLSVVSGDFPRPAVLFLETMSRDAAGVPEIKAVVDAIDGAVAKIGRDIAHKISGLKGPARLSVIADDGVRKIGATGLPRSGREFDLPYKKSLHITMTPFSGQFCDAFVKLVNAAYEHPGLKVVVQAVVGGGDFLANGPRRTTHMQRRRGLVQLVFDVFYESGYEADAAGYQRDMKKLLASFSNGDDLRMLWGTFEDPGTSSQLDMRQTATRAFYYDSAAEYARLQQIKRYTDPKDLFRTSFTVQLPP